MDFTVHISEAGEEYNEKIEVDPNKRTELFQVPAHPGVDRSDTFHDFKQNLTMLRFPDDKVCYVFPLLNEQSTPEKLIRDLEKAKQVVITETRRIDTTWIVEGELTDRSALSDELGDICAQYPIYHVKEVQETLEVTGIRTKEKGNRKRRQSGSSLNGAALCPGGMDLNTAYQICSEPKSKCKTRLSCSKSVRCGLARRRRFGFWWGSHHYRPSRSSCWDEHTTRRVTECCEYFCENAGNPNNGTAEIFERL